MRQAVQRRRLFQNPADLQVRPSSLSELCLHESLELELLGLSHAEYGVAYPFDVQEGAVHDANFGRETSTYQVGALSPRQRKVPNVKKRTQAPKPGLQLEDDFSSFLRSDMAEPGREVFRSRQRLGVESFEKGISRRARLGIGWHRRKFFLATCLGEKPLSVP